MIHLVCWSANTLLINTLIQPFANQWFLTLTSVNNWKTRGWVATLWGQSPFALSVISCCCFWGYKRVSYRIDWHSLTAIVAMNSTLVILLLSALALVQARNIRWSEEDNSSQGPSLSHPHPHSVNWPCDVGHFPEAFILMHKVDKRLERIDNESTKKRIENYAVNQLRQCILDGQMDVHCVRRSIGYTMSFIHHQMSQANGM